MFRLKTVFLAICHLNAPKERLKKDLMGRDSSSPEMELERTGEGFYSH
jgi:hypothetical protein